MITDDEIAELDKQFHNHCVDADSALTSIPLLIARLRAAEARIEELQLMAMDEDNLWDLKRADEMRSAIRDWAANYFQATKAASK